MRRGEKRLLGRDADTVQKNMDRVTFYWFSGTGNTLLVARKMAETFREGGAEAELVRMEDADPGKIRTDEMIGLAFPVAEQGTYPFVWDFVRGLPEANGVPIFMVDTMLAYSGGVVGPMRRIVERKGYKPVGAREIRMPNNLFPRRIDEERNAKKIDAGLAEAERFAKDILAGASKWGRVPGGSDVMSLFSQWNATWKFFRWLYDLQIDRERCTKCGLCARLCPIGNIEMREYPELKGGCEFCMRCISFCPAGAVGRGKGGRERYRAVRAKELLGNDERRNL